MLLFFYLIINLFSANYCQVITSIINPEGGPEYTCNLEEDGLFKCNNCQATFWTNWGSCSGCNGVISRERSLTNISGVGNKPPTKEEVKCLTNQACEICSFSEWSEWSTCSNSCDTGTKYRTRRVTSNKACIVSDEKLNLYELATCENEPCNCDESLTGTNGLYYRGCQKYSRTGQKCVNWKSLNIDAFNYLSTLENSGIGDHSYCRNPISNNTLIPTIWCYVSKDPLTPQLCDPIPTDCKVSEWSQWSDCSTTCENGKVTRSRTIIQEMKNGGEECPIDLVQTQDCYVDVVCPVDCVLGSWSHWSTCSTECGQGNSTRSRNIITYPRGSGAVCEEYSQIKSCNGENCLSFWQKNKYTVISFSLLGISLLASIIYILIPNNRSV